MDWIVFKYENGSNPYISKTEKDFERMLKKYKNNVVKISNDFYYIKENKENKIFDFPLF